MGQIRFSEFLEIISSFFAKNFCTDRVDILLCSERKKTGFFPQNLSLLTPRSIVGVGDKRAHDSDHAVCWQELRNKLRRYSGKFLQFFVNGAQSHDVVMSVLYCVGIDASSATVR